MATPRTSKPGCVGHGRASANGTTPYAPCLVSPTPLPGNLLHTNLPPAAQEICTRAGLFRLVWSYPTGGDSKFFSRICAKVGDLRSVFRLGSERRFLACNHPFSVLGPGHLAHLRPASANTRVSGERGERGRIDHDT